MEWSDVRIYLAIAREGTLGGAARSLGQTQPTMGRRLRALEAAIGQTLFQRTADGFILTSEGAAVLPHAERIEEEALAFERRLAGTDARLEGFLRLSSSEWFGTHLLAPVLAEFAGRHPGVCVELLTDTRLYSLQRREADLVFRIAPFDEAGLISRRLMDMPYALYGREGDRLDPEGEGDGQRLVTMDTAFDDMPDLAWMRHVLPRAVIAARSNSRDVQARLCAAGVGLAVLPRPLGEAMPGLVAIDLGTSPPERATYLGYHRDLRRLPRLRALLDLVVERLAN
ncbi:MAG TPA: LysR family transcriptional regulator [Sphingomonas sp.]|nr:LysR family transcriptional regulator [Sphingomonas sp.]